MILAERQARAILEKALRLSQGDLERMFGRAG